MTTFSRSDAARLGVRDADLRRALAGGVVQRTRRGWYTVAPPAAGLSPHELQRRAHLARCAAVQRDHRLPLSAHSALARLGLPTPPLARRPVHLSGRPARSRAGVVVGTPLPGAPADLGVGGTVPLVDAVLTSALLDPVHALGAADEAIRLGRLDVGGLRAALPRIDGRPGALRARTALALADGRRESPAESWFAWLAHGWGIDVDPQVVIDTDEGPARVDFVVAGVRVVVEVDGALKYDDPTALFREKRREDALRRAGYEVVRVLWEDLLNPERLLQRLHDAMAQATGRLAVR